MPFTDAQLVDIRRFCGYPAFGAGASAGFGQRFITVYGRLEWIMQNLDPNEMTVVITIYLANLYSLETALVNTGANLDTDEAAVWKHNKNEQADRESLFFSWRLKLCQFLGVPPGPALVDPAALTMVL